MCKLGYLDIVRDLLEVGYYVNVKGRYDILFIVVCVKGDLVVVEELIRVREVDVNLSVKNKIFLIEVCVKGYKDIVKYLIRNGVEVNLEVGDNIFFIVVCREN